MKYVSEKYEKQLSDLAEHLMRPVGDAALQDTVEFEPIAEEPSARVIQFPAQLRLLDPPELGWEYSPGPEAA